MYYCNRVHVIDVLIGRTMWNSTQLCLMFYFKFKSSCLFSSTFKFLDTTQRIVVSASDGSTSAAPHGSYVN